MLSIDLFVLETEYALASLFLSKYIFDSIHSPSKHLWTLLMGKTLLASYEVVHDELKRSCDKIISGLQAFATLKPAEIEAYKKKFEGTGMTLSPKDKLRRALVEKLVRMWDDWNN